MLAERCFNASFVNEHDNSMLESAPFMIVEPFPAATARVRLLAQQSVLDERSVSPNAPRVTLHVPNGGEQWDGVQAISWSASDGDADPLTFSVFYSADDGVTWHLVAEGLEQQSLVWDTGQSAGSGAARVRVLASDGLNTTFDDSDRSFEVARKAPAAQIALPFDGALFRRVEAVLMVGRGTDREDGELGGAALTWTSDRDGVLGTGNHVAPPELSRGHHVIALTAIDSDGATARAQVTIEVLTPAPPAECGGDCGGNRSVTVDELLVMVNVALGSVAASECLEGDTNRDGDITVDELLIGVNHALAGCENTATSIR
jgi:hypothetical protein